MKYLNHIKTLNSVTIILDDRAPITVYSSNPVYKEVSELLQKRLFDDIPNTVDRAERVKSTSNGLFEVVDGVITLDGQKLPDSLSKRILQFAEANLNYQPLVNFWYNLRDNPTEGSRKDLYTFLERNHVPITEDGSFIAYKKVRENYKDTHSNSVLYQVGTLVRMPRESVNANRHETCAPGLHVAGWGYMPHFTGQRILEVKVNPKNVVAVPVDYEFTKIRVCELEVIKDCSGYMDEKVQVYDKDTDDHKPVTYSGPDGDDGAIVDPNPGVFDEEEPVVDEEVEEADTPIIRRIPSHLSKLALNTKNQLRVINVVLDKIGLGPSNAVYVSTTTRKKKLILSGAERENHLAKLEAGTTSVLIPAKALKLAGLTGKKFKIKVTLGTLEITPA